MPTTPLAAPADLDGVLQRHQHNPTRLLQILIDAQDLAGWLPAPTPLTSALYVNRRRLCDFF